MLMLQQRDDMRLQNIRFALKLEDNLFPVDLYPDLADLNRPQPLEYLQHWLDRNLAVVLLEAVVRSLAEADEILQPEVGHHVGRVNRIQGLERQSRRQGLQIQLGPDFGEEIHRSGEDCCWGIMQLGLEILSSSNGQQGYLLFMFLPVMMQFILIRLIVYFR